MIIIRNNIIPFPGFAAINLFGILFVRKNVTVTDRMINHEKIHTAQMKEMLFIFFYIWYLVEWIVRLFINGPEDAYYNIGFEQEAYKNDDDLGYLGTRKHFSWFKYM